MPASQPATVMDQVPTSGDLKHHKRNNTGARGQKHNQVELTKEQWQHWNELMKQDDINVNSVEKSVVKHALTTLARTPYNLDGLAAYQSVAHSVRDQLISRWNETQNYHTAQNMKRVYYMSLEFLIGRSLDNAILNMELKGTYKDAMRQLGFDLENVIEEEVDAALGNGGLGRLAACFMDSLASQNYPAWGYGLRYNYGIFQQRIIDGFQVEFPDYWLTYDNPWELPRLDVTYDVRFNGTVQREVDANGKAKCRWEGGEVVQAVAYDVPIPGWKTKNTINIRLWRSVPKKKFDLASFNEGNYQKSVEENIRAENITSVLYPNDHTMAGKELRLKQQYFFCSATLRDIIRRFKKKNQDWKNFPDHVAIQLNDTHPTLGIAELQRILVDEEGLEWDAAWSIVTKVFSFTNHTVLPEAMEKWSVPMLQELLPRHMQIIFDINLFFLQNVEKKFPNDRDRLARMSIIEEGMPQFVRMAHLAIVGSHTINGVASIHSSLIKQTIFQDFVKFYGDEKFQNKTNGITPRRWLHQSNPDLSDLITKTLGNQDWLKNLSLLKNLKKFADDQQFQQKWMQVKLENKIRLANYIKDNNEIDVDPNVMFDIQVKRIHEYKRQFMNILSVIHRYYQLKAMTEEQRKTAVPRVVIFAGKAAPGYYIAKLVIKLINSVGDVVNNDPQTSKWLKVVFLQDYNVSLAEVIIPASDISQHISTAGTEASGTSNMKFVLNGGLILGTHDGANVEIAEEIGSENIFNFGLKADQVDEARHQQRYRKTPMNKDLAAVLSQLQKGAFGNAKVLQPLLDTLTVGGDHYLLSVDFASYLDAQERVDKAFQDKKKWARMSILCSGGMGKFSSDRSIQEYAEQIWKIKPCALP
ncbi:hypothetical protein MIR68_002849 [Amoeboaphelidium protococcarum]|nr:hypothetical protein MIR68_002849 [Amoeboaphelidium protococcarum]